VSTRTSSRRSTRLAIASAVLCVLLALAPSAAIAEEGGSMGKNVGVGVGSAFASLVYAPVKLCYAFGGLLVGGMAWAFSGGDNDVAMVVITPSVLGDYVITPDHLTGEQSIEFFGRDPQYAEENLDVAAAPVEPDYDQAW
jgi:hypothetical protein